MPYPQWVDPQMIYGSELNAIVSQTIARFASAAERAAAIVAPEVGQVTYVDGIGYQMFDGSQWSTFTVGPRLIGGRSYPGTDNLALMPDHSADDETYAGMTSGPVALAGGNRYAVDVYACVRTTIANDVLRLTVREDDGGSHLTGLIVGYFETWPLRALTDHIVSLTFEYAASENMTRTYVVTAQRVVGSGEIWVRRRDLTTELASPRVTVREVGRSSLVIAA